MCEATKNPCGLALILAYNYERFVKLRLHARAYTWPEILGMGTRSHDSRMIECPVMFGWWTPVGTTALNANLMVLAPVVIALNM